MHIAHEKASLVSSEMGHSRIEKNTFRPLRIGTTSAYLLCLCDVTIMQPRKGNNFTMQKVACSGNYKCGEWNHYRRYLSGVLDVLHSKRQCLPRRIKVLRKRNENVIYERVAGTKFPTRLGVIMVWFWSDDFQCLLTSFDRLFELHIIIIKMERISNSEANIYICIFYCGCAFYRGCIGGPQ